MRKRLKNKNELFNEEGKLKYTNLTNFDLSDIDLSDVDPSVWENVIFYNTNFNNTGIKFYPNKLRKVHYLFDERSIEYCSFENCDLSYLTDEDFKFVNIGGTNFRNTNLQIDFRNNLVFSLSHNPIYSVSRQDDSQRVNLKNGTILPSWYKDKPYDYFDYADVDMEFIRNNSHIKISSGKLLEAISEVPYGFNCPYEEVSDADFEYYYHQFLEFLEYDKEGLLKRFYRDIKPYLTSKSKYLHFFKGKIEKIDFDELDLTYLSNKMLASILFNECHFNKVKLGASYKELNKEISKRLYINCFMMSSPINELILPMSIHDWQNASKRRLNRSNITMQTNLYLEFERICNMCCKFCRNDAFQNDQFNFDKIMKTLKGIFPHLNNIVIGGGEPTIHLTELKDLSRAIEYLKNYRSKKLYIITNCSLDFDSYSRLNNYYNYNFYFSRHAVEDAENKKIFNDINDRIMTTDDLIHIPNRKNQVMCCTCFKGGVDNVSKILEYVQYVEYIGYQNILFQNLHLEDEYNRDININEDIMTEAIEKLREQGFSVKQPIFSNSNYVLYLLKKDDFQISFKIYKNQEVILDAWNKSSKRCFDLSIDPSGNLHETWKEPTDINILQRKIS